MQRNSSGDLTTIVEEIREEFPRFRIVYKRHDGLSMFLDVILRVITFGSQREYMTRYHTVLGNTLYVPESWDHTPDLDRIITLRHERVHLRQRQRYGDILMAVIYLLPIFPLGLAYGRARIEWEAYAETIRATAELRGHAAARDPLLRQHIVRQFVSGAYGWMWPFPATIAKWYDEVLAQLSADPSTSDQSLRE